MRSQKSRRAFLQKLLCGMSLLAPSTSVLAAMGPAARDEKKAELIEKYITQSGHREKIKKIAREHAALSRARGRSVKKHCRYPIMIQKYRSFLDEHLDAKELSELLEGSDSNSIRKLKILMGRYRPLSHEHVFG